MQQLCRPFLHAMTGGRAPTFLELDGSQETVVDVARPLSFVEGEAALA